MLKQYRGSEQFHFAKSEAKLSLNWATLVVSLSVAFLVWVGSDVVPALAEHGGALAGVSGLLAVLVPVLVNYLRNNRDITINVQE